MQTNQSTGELPTEKWPTALEKKMDEAEKPTGAHLRLATGEIISFLHAKDCGNGFVHLYSPRFVYPRDLKRRLDFELDGMELRRDSIVWVADEGISDMEAIRRDAMPKDD